MEWNRERWENGCYGYKGFQITSAAVARGMAAGVKYALKTLEMELSPKLTRMVLTQTIKQFEDEAERISATDFAEKEAYDVNMAEAVREQGANESSYGSSLEGERYE